MQRTVWPEDGILEAEEWPATTGEALRGHEGIHAARMPRDWERADPHHNEELRIGINHWAILVDGIVERYGRAVVGDRGWRAERVVIRRLRAPSTEVGLAIEAAYPTIGVFYPAYTEATR